MPVSAPITLPIDVGYYQSDSGPVANQVSTNVLPWVEETEGGSVRGYLRSRFGIETVNTINGEFFGLHLFNSILYAIIGDKLYTVNFSDDSVTSVGTFTNQGSDDAVIDDNGETMAILFPGNSLWFYDTTNGLVRSTDTVVQGYEAETGGIQTLAHVNGFFVYNTYAEAFSGSSVNTNLGQNFDALDFIRPFLNEKSIRVINIRNELYIFGENRAKLFVSDVTGSFPFTEVKGGSLDKGVLNRYAIQAFDNSAVFIGGAQGEESSVWRLTGAGGVSNISTPAIDSRINALASTESAVQLAQTFKFSMDKHFFFGFTVGGSGAEETYFYDATSSALKGRHIYSRFKSFNTGWLPGGMAEAYGRFYTLGSSVGLGRLSKTEYEDYGFAYDRQFSGYYLRNQNRPLSVDSLELVAETGVGNEWISVNTEDREPEVTLEISRDRGRTFTNMGTRHLGRYQEYNTRLIWRNLGECETDVLFRFTCSASVKQTYLEIIVEAEGGNP